MATKRVGLQLVDTDTGQITEQACPGCFKRDEDIAALKVEKRSWRTRYYNERRRNEAEWEGHDLFPTAKRLFDLYREIVRHPHHKQGGYFRKCPACSRTLFTVDRFNEVKPRLLEHGDEAEELCIRAIQGARYDPFVTQRKNGSLKYHNEWHQIFAPDKFMEFANKAPYHLPDPEKVHTLTKALVFVHGWDIERAVAEAQRRLRR